MTSARRRGGARSVEWHGEASEMPAGYATVWTAAMDDIVLSHSARDAAARLGLPLLIVQVRRRKLADLGRTLVVPIIRGRPRGRARGPSASVREMIRRFGLGFPPKSIAELRGVSHQAVYQALTAYVRPPARALSGIEATKASPLD